MAEIKPDKPRGILHYNKNSKKFLLKRYMSTKVLKPFVEHYWLVRWNLPENVKQLQETLPHPSVHMVVEQGRSEIVGVVESKYMRALEGQGFVFGIKFRPGGFYPFAGFNISDITNKTIKFSEVFGREGELYEADILSAGSDVKMADIAESFLQKRLSEKDDNILLVNKIVELTIKDRDIKKVEDIVSSFKINKRTLQRLFRQYVGVSPKWVIKRYRLHEALEQLDNGGTIDWTKLALDLGYFDQSHFIKDFKALISKTPEEYVKKNM